MPSSVDDSWMMGRVASALAVSLVALSVLLVPSADAFGRGGRGGGYGAGNAGSSRPAAPKLSPKSSSGQQSGPTTYGYWDGSRWVRNPGPWTMPNGRPGPSRQR